MKTGLTSIFLVFSLFLGATAPVFAASPVAEESRFFVQTTNGFWRNTLGVRHEFEDGFTTESSGLQLQLAKLMGVKIFPVKKLTILPASPAGGPAEPDVQPVAQAGASPDIVPGPPASVPEARRPRPTPERPTPTVQVPWGVAMLYAGALPDASGGASVSVAVLDTGITRNHPDLERRIKGCKDFSQAKAPVVEDKCDDGNGHGTHVAGIIAADGGTDGLGIYGVAPGANLMAYKVCGNSGSCWSDDIAAAIRTAADNGANIINMSLGSDAISSLIGDAVAYARGKGVLVIAAAGNDGPYPDSVDYPGALADVVAVGALDVNRAVADFSSRGRNSATEPFVSNEGDIEFAAPGVNVESTYKDGGYAILSGTSMASPYLAGLAALAWQNLADAPADATRVILHNLTTDLEPAGDDDSSGWGLPTLSQ